MPTKIRLARHGKKKAPYYHIVVADSRAPRDGKFIERIGTYNPITNPASIDINFEKALHWLNTGAVPSDTCRAILSYTGVYMKKHLLEGVKKGAFDEATAEKRFSEWSEAKQKKIQDKRNKIGKDMASSIQEQLDAETKVKEARAEAIAKKLAQAAAKEVEAEEAEVAVAEETPAVVDEAPAATEETPAEEAPEEKPEA